MFCTAAAAGWCLQILQKNFDKIEKKKEEVEKIKLLPVSKKLDLGQKVKIEIRVCLHVCLIVYVCVCASVCICLDVCIFCRFWMFDFVIQMLQSQAAKIKIKKKAKYYHPSSQFSKRKRHRIKSLIICRLNFGTEWKIFWFNNCFFFVQQNAHS